MVSLNRDNLYSKRFTSRFAGASGRCLSKGRGAGAEASGWEDLSPLFRIGALQDTGFPRLFEFATSICRDEGCPYKAGQKIIYLFGELCRLANDLPAHLMATATRV
jgi:hypothetical protein